MPKGPTARTDMTQTPWQKALAALSAALTSALTATMAATMAAALLVAAAARANDDDPLIVDYRYIDEIFESVVLVTGQSDRQVARPAPPPTGSRISRGPASITRLEANRVFYHHMDDDDQRYVGQMLEDLAILGEPEDYDRMLADEQLAFWLNLRNLMVYEAVVTRYPISKLNKFHSTAWSKPRLTIAGKPVSIESIEDYIVTRWPDPRVLYGLFQGEIGGPNLRPKSFYGETVWNDLEDNAFEFVNSLRGIAFWGSTAKVSSLYYRFASLFPDFERDLRHHIRSFARRDVKNGLVRTRQFLPSRYDWNIADIYNGRPYSNTSYSGQTIRLRFGGMEDVRNTLPTYASLFLEEIGLRNLRRDSRVSIERIDDGKSAPDDEEDDAEKDDDAKKGDEKPDDEKRETEKPDDPDR